MRPLPPILALLVSAGLLLGNEPFDDSTAPFSTDVRTGGRNSLSRQPRLAREKASIFEEEATPVVSSPKVKDRPPERVPAVQSPAVAPPAPAPGLVEAASAAPNVASPAVAPLTMAELLEAGRLSEVGKVARETQDGQLAVALAWAYYRQGDFSQAERWFALGSEWGGGPADDVQYGQAVAVLGMGEPDKALQRIKPLLPREERARLLYADLSARRAAEVYAVGEYGEAVKLLEQAYQYRYLTREEQLLMGWSQLGSGKTQDGANTFEGLYRAYRDQASADGLIGAYGATHQGRDYLIGLNQALPGPLGKNPLLIDPVSVPGSLASASGRHYAAAAENPELEAAMPGLTAPSLYLGVGYAAKSGDAGMGRLSILSLPLVGAHGVLFGRNELTLQAAAVRMQAGDPEITAELGTPPVIPPGTVSPFTAFPYKPTDHVYGEKYDIAWRYHGDTYSPYAAIGLSPEGPIDPRLNGRLGLSYFGKAGAIEGEAFYQPVKESLLSYTGVRDPWTGLKWGRVMSAGGRVAATAYLPNDWSLRGEAYASYLKGKNVESNANLGMNLGLRKTIPVEGFGYLAAGPDLAFLHYDKNLANFTYGQGGYFSPDYLVQADIGLNLLTEEGKTWLIKADALVGYQMNSQASSPFYPLAPDGQVHPSVRDSSFILGVRGQAAVLLSSQWMLGGFIEANKTADYDAIGIGLYLSFLFSDRGGLFREDLQKIIW